MRRSERLRSASRWQEATEHRFVAELGDGSLAADVFGRYLVQDYAFITTLVEVVAYAVAQAPDMAAKRHLSRFLAVLTGEENTYFEKAFATLGIGEEAWRRPSLHPVTASFRDFLLRAAAIGGFAETLAALLPVEWVYLTWASRAAERAPSHPLYRGWIDLHADPDFRAFVMWMIETMDALLLSEPEERAVAENFARAVAFEVAFWEMAYEG